MTCPECDTPIGIAVMDDREDKNYRHILEICPYCGYQKTYVDYLDD